MAKRQPEISEVVGIMIISLIIGAVALLPICVCVVVALDWSVTRVAALGFAIDWTLAVFFAGAAVVMGVDQ